MSQSPKPWGVMDLAGPLWWTDASNVETAMAALEGAMRVEEGTWP